MAPGEGGSTFVDEVLARHAERADQYRSVEVEKHIQPEFDLALLAASDVNSVDPAQLKSNSETYLKELSRDNTQLLINQIWQLPIERMEDAIVAKLPKATTRLPREKPVPKPKPLTKWENYAQQKGIQNKKKAKLVWDEQLQKWLPRYGHKRAAAQKDKTWMLEVPQNADPYEDQFAKLREQKQERVAQNEVKRLQNVARAHKLTVTPTQSTGPAQEVTKTTPSDELRSAVQQVRRSTASLGKFTRKLPKEKVTSGGAEGKRRKFDPVIGDSGRELARSLDILDKVTSRQAAVDVEKAAGRHIHAEEVKRSKEKAERGASRRGGSKGGKKRRAAPNRGRKGKMNAKSSKFKKRK